MYMGPIALKEAIETAKPYPIDGLLEFRDFFDEIDVYYHQTHGYGMVSQPDGRMWIAYIMQSIKVSVSFWY